MLEPSKQMLLGADTAISATTVLLAMSTRLTELGVTAQTLDPSKARARGSFTRSQLEIIDPWGLNLSRPEGNPAHILTPSKTSDRAPANQKRPEIVRLVTSTIA